MNWNKNQPKIILHVLGIPRHVFDFNFDFAVLLFFFFSLEIFEKYLQHQQDLCYVFIDFKKAFDRVWLASLRATMKKYNISTNLIQVIKNLSTKAISAVLFNSSIGDWFRTTVGIRQGCLLSHALFNIFLEGS